MTKSDIGRPFDIENIPPEIRRQLNALRESAADVSRMDPEAFDRLMMEHYKILEVEKERQKKIYPANPPNEKCHHALINGTLVFNADSFKVHDLIPYFRVGHETLYIWVHSTDLHPVLLVDVDVPATPQNIWRSLASILELTQAIRSSFEHIDNYDYDWIYNFNPRKSLKENEFLNPENIDRLSGTVHQLSYFAEFAPLIELLYRDERFYVMCMNLLASFNNHHFCLICAFEKEGYQKHPSHELPPWQAAQAIPKMEVAIVQATRAVEAVLGKPGKRDTDSKLQRTLKRWYDAIDLEPNLSYELTDKSNIDYYFELFSIRGEAAHSLGAFPYQLSRQLTIEAQCFAWIILNSYYSKNALSKAKAINALNFNPDLIRRDER